METLSMVFLQGFEPLAHSENTPIAAFRNSERRIYGLQWHPEVVHTEKGRPVIENFIFKVCGCQPNWTMVVLLKKL